MSAVSTFVMPKLGLTMTEGVVTSWLVRPGDQVRSGDVLVVVETEKIATEVESPGDGRIETIEVAEGSTVPVGAVLATWTGADVAQRGSYPESNNVYRNNTVSIALSPDNAPAAQPLVAHSGSGERLIATPLARRLAKDAKITLSTVSGSGPRGRIKARDVDAAVADASRQLVPPAAVEQACLAGSPASVRRPATALEKTIARRMTQAKQIIPHFYVQAEVDVSRLLTLREELNAIEGFVRVSINHLVIVAVGRVLVQMPEINVLWSDDEVIQLTDSDVGFAVDTERGLFAPVIHRVNDMGLDALARAANDLAGRAKEGRLAADELTGGAITVSNVGMYGASHLIPIINPGQSAILGVAAIKPVFRPDADGQPMLQREIGLVLACDHRVLDGVKAARFLDCVANQLKNPLLLLRA
ncbi:dihydrolipoamide acetyltransferase family protein [Bradyrhizobium sp.]|uniref:dihydrolipoamide acetyltransferase family protein n=1 Tax=Bradyrhizobium sp. TaxID=376 RepID=UPI003C768A60